MQQGRTKSKVGSLNQMTKIINLQLGKKKERRYTYKTKLQI